MMKTPLLIAICLLAAAQESAGEPAALAAKLHAEGLQHLKAGKTRQAVEALQGATAAFRQAYPNTTHPHGRPEMARCFASLGFALRRLDEYDAAVPALEEALRQARGLTAAGQFPTGRHFMAGVLNALGDVHCSTSNYRQAYVSYEESLALNRQLFPKEKYPDGHSSLAGALFWMGRVHREMGTPLRALAYYEEALAMLRRLYPKEKHAQGHPELAAGLSAVGEMLSLLGAPKEALALREEAFEMSLRSLPPETDPRGWAARSTLLGNMAESYHRAGDFRRALPLFEQALHLSRKTSPSAGSSKGSFGLGLFLTNYAACLHNAGEGERGLAMMREANALFHQLFPKKSHPGGHIDIVITSCELAHQLRDLGRRDEARAAYDTAMEACRGYQAKLVAQSSEADALKMSQEFFAKTRDGYLSVVAASAVNDAAAYSHVWHTKALVMRLLERRHVAARLAAADPKGGTGLVNQWRELSEVRRQLELAQQAERSAERDKRLHELTERKERLERELIAAAPELAHDPQRDRQTPHDLAKALPAGTVFVDFLQWTRYEQDPAVPGQKGLRETPSYSAFVIVAGRPVRRIDLGAAAPIDAVVQAWRDEIQNPGQAKEKASAAARLRELVWTPVKATLPSDVRVIYLATDGELGRAPFAALPAEKPGRILLEDYVMARAPHGPFLLEHLQRPIQASREPAAVLALGDVDYGAVAPGQQRVGWPALPGAAVEVRQVSAMAAAAGPANALTGKAATSQALLRELPKARYAHLATHGFFRGDELDAEEQRLREYYLGKYKIEPQGKSMGMVNASRNPLAFVGLVLAGANERPASKTDGVDAIVTGETLVTLPLERLHLCVLSACETGLGESTAGEGVQGLQRAFHVAGCPNVVASLWKVNDAATAALMAKFYHEMWVNKKPPIEALREAQLTIYRHPELIPALAGERGRPELDKAVRVSASALPSGRRDRADTRLWAAFVLSGVGK